MNQKSILITGAAAGIGAATARHFAARGWTVGLADLNFSAVQGLATELGAQRAHAYKLDVVDKANFQQVLAEFWQQAGGRLDVMLNNAGVVMAGDFESHDLERCAQMVDVNFKGVVNGASIAFPYLQKTSGSCLINLSSASAITGSPGFAVYSASKFAVRGFTEALDMEWARHGIRVLDIMPLFVQTAMVDQIGQRDSVAALGVRLNPNDIAGSIWNAAHSSTALRGPHRVPGLQGWLLYIGGKLLPAFVNRFVGRKLSGY